MTPLRYSCLRASAQPVFEGKLESGEWVKAPWTTDFVDIEGDKNPLPPFRTRVKMLWDDQFWYIACELEEPHLWATLTEHDSVIFQDNDFELFADPDGDGLNYFEYEVNAFGTDWDLMLDKPYRDGGNADSSWETPGRIVKITLDGTLNDPSDVDRGWVVELALPWSAFAEKAGAPCPPRHADTWRVNFSRVAWDLEVVDGQYRKIEGRPEHNWVWTPQYEINMHAPEHWGFVSFENF